MMMRHSLVASVALAVFTAVLAVHAQDTTGKGGPPQIGKGKDGQPTLNNKELAKIELELKDKFSAFEKSLLTLQQRLANSADEKDKARAAQLKKVLENISEKDITKQFSEFIRVLSQQATLANSGDIQQAVDKSFALARDLKDLLDLLRNDNGAGNRKEERIALEKLLKELERVIRDQRIIGTEIQTNPDHKIVASNQGDVKTEAEKIADQLGKGSQGADPKDFKGTSKEGGAGEKAEAKPEGKPAEGAKAGEGKKPGEEGGAAKPGEPKDGKGDPKAGGGKGDPKDGKGDPKGGGKGDPKDGKGDPKGGGGKGDPKDGKGDPKAGGGKGDPKEPGAAKPSPDAQAPKDAGASKPGDSPKTPAESKPSQAPGQQGESKPGSDSKGQGEAKPGQPKEGGGDQPPPPVAGGKSDNQPPPKGGPNDPKDNTAQIKKKIQEGTQNQESAQDSIAKSKKDDAAKESDKAIDSFEQARKKLEALIRQLREEEMERVLANLIQRCQKMLAMQEEVLRGTVRVQALTEAKPNADALRKISQDCL
ncbi:MAG TPA: hypothetical protein VE988_19490, partial [Gemmataceae bacterium]|nr:hypothetical protein [Gemmataceae bacterium]